MLRETARCNDFTMALEIIIISIIIIIDVVRHIASASRCDAYFNEISSSAVCNA